MLVDSMISAPPRACSSTPSLPRLRAQITTSASPMSRAPRTVSRSGAPGPAPMNQTLPKLAAPPREDEGREIRALAPHYLGGPGHLFPLHTQPRAVDGLFEPPALGGDLQHLPKPAPALVAHDGLEA